MLAHPLFDSVMAFYALCGAGCLRYLWTCRTPMAASVHRLSIPKLDETPLVLHSSSDVGVV